MSSPGSPKTITGSEASPSPPAPSELGSGGDALSPSSPVAPSATRREDAGAATEEHPSSPNQDKSLSPENDAAKANSTAAATEEGASQDITAKSPKSGGSKLVATEYDALVARGVATSRSKEETKKTKDTGDTTSGDPNNPATAVGIKLVANEFDSLVARGVANSRSKAEEDKKPKDSANGEGSPGSPTPNPAAINESDSLPGAYAARRNTPVEGLASGDVEAAISSSDSSSTPAGGGGGAINALVTASPVAPEESPGAAEPVDMVAAERKRLEVEMKKKFFLLVLGCFVFVAVAFTVGLLLGGANNDSQAVSVDTRPPYSAPTSAPSGAPSTAPTGYLDAMLQELPDYTLESLTRANSPQWRALAWVEGHPELPTMPVWRQKQLFALVTFFYSMEGPNWLRVIRENWLNYDINECYWFSSNFGYFQPNGNFEQEWIPHFANPEANVDTCDNVTGEFYDLSLNLLGLAGLRPSIPPEITLLSNLYFLYLFESEMEGKLEDFIPTQMYEMESLGHLHIYQNRFTGTIPSHFYQITALDAFDLSENQLTGTIATQIGLLTNVGFIDLYTNFLTGTIPTEIILVNNTEELWLYDNQLSGTIPTELCGMPILDGLSLHINDFTGQIPSEFGSMTQLLTLDLSNLPLLDGTIPTELGSIAFNHTFADFTIVNSTGLYGTLPEGLCRLQEPGCTKEHYWFGDVNCSLSFDCSAELCGCDCDCADFNDAGSNETLANDTMVNDATADDAVTNTTVATGIETNDALGLSAINASDNQV